MENYVIKNFLLEIYVHESNLYKKLNKHVLNEYSNAYIFES